MASFSVCVCEICISYSAVLQAFTIKNEFTFYIIMVHYVNVYKYVYWNKIYAYAYSLTLIVAKALQTAQ